MKNTLIIYSDSDDCQRPRVNFKKLPIARNSVVKFAPKEPVMGNFYFSPCPQDRNAICFNLPPDSAPVGTSYQL